MILITLGYDGSTRVYIARGSVGSVSARRSMKFAVEHLLVESEHAPPLGCLVEHVRVDPGGEAGIGVPKVLCDLVDRAAR